MTTKWYSTNYMKYKKVDSINILVQIIFGIDLNTVLLCTQYWIDPLSTFKNKVNYKDLTKNIIFCNCPTFDLHKGRILFTGVETVRCSYDKRYFKTSIRSFLIYEIFQNWCQFDHIKNLNDHFVFKWSFFKNLISLK